MPRTTGKKRRTIIEETLPDGPEEGTEGEPTSFDVSMESVEDVETLQEVLGQFGETNVVLKVLRQTASGAEFCYQTDILDEEFIQKNFGGGTYQVRVFIGARYRKTIKIQIASRITQPVLGTPIATENRHSEFLEKMVLALVSRDNVGTPPSSIAEISQAMTQLHALNPAPVSTPEKLMEHFLKGVEFAKGLNGDTPDWKTSLLEVAKEVAPALLGGFTKIPGTPIPGQPVVTAAPDPNATLKAGITYMKKKFIGGADPLVFVDFIVMNRDEEQYQGLIHAILSKDYAEFALLDPEIGTEPFINYFKPVYDGIRSAFKPDDSVEDDPTGNGGDSANIGSYGANGKGGKK